LTQYGEDSVENSSRSGFGGFPAGRDLLIALVLPGHPDARISTAEPVTRNAKRNLRVAVGDDCRPGRRLGPAPQVHGRRSGGTETRLMVVGGYGAAPVPRQLSGHRLSSALGPPSPTVDTEPPSACTTFTHRETALTQYGEIVPFKNSKQ